MFTHWKKFPPISFRCSVYWQSHRENFLCSCSWVTLEAWGITAHPTLHLYLNPTEDSRASLQHTMSLPLLMLNVSSPASCWALRSTSFLSINTSPLNQPWTITSHGRYVCPRHSNDKIIRKWWLTDWIISEPALIKIKQKVHNQHWIFLDFPCFNAFCIHCFLDSTF